MSYVYVFLKMLGELGLWLACAAPLLSLFTPVSNLFLLLPLWGCCAVLGYALREKRFPLTALLPAFAAYFLCNGMGDWLLVIPSLYFLLQSIRKGSLLPDYTTLFYRFRLRAAILFLAGLLCIWQKQDWAFVAAMLCIGSDIFLLRSLRHNPNDYQDKRLLGFELGLLCAVFALCLLLSTPLALQWGYALLKLIFRFAIKPLVMLFLSIVLGFFWILSWVLGLFFSGKVELPTNMGGGMGSMSMVEEYAEEVNASGHPIFLLVMQIIGVCLFLWLGFLLFRYLSKAAVTKKTEKGNPDMRQSIADQPHKNPDPTPGILDRSPEAGVRRAYRNYLDAVEQSKGWLRPMDTSRSVNEKAFADSPAEARELRKLYLCARYRSGKGSRPGDAKKAAALVKKLKQQLAQKES